MKDYKTIYKSITGKELDETQVISPELESLLKDSNPRYKEAAKAYALMESEDVVKEFLTKGTSVKDSLDRNVGETIFQLTTDTYQGVQPQNSVDFARKQTFNVNQYTVPQALFGSAYRESNIFQKASEYLKSPEKYLELSPNRVLLNETARLYNRINNRDESDPNYKVSDLNFDPEEQVIKMGKPHYASYFKDVTSKAEFVEALEKIEGMENIIQASAEHPIAGMLGAIGGGSLEMLFVPNILGKAIEAGKLTSMTTGVLFGAGITSSETILQEYMLQNSDPTRTAEESAQALVFSSVIGGGIGGVMGGVAHSVLTPKAYAQDIGDIVQGHAPANKQKLAGELGYKGDDAHIQMDLDVDAEFNHLFLDYDQLQDYTKTNSGSQKSATADSYIGETVRKASLPLSRARQAASSEVNAVNNFATLMVTRTENFAGNRLNTRAPVEHMSELMQGQLLKYANTYNKERKNIQKWLVENKVEPNDENIGKLIFRSISSKEPLDVKFKDGSQLNLQGMRSEILRIQDNLKDEMIRQNIHISPNQLNVKLKENYTPFIIDANKRTDITAKKAVRENLEGIRQEVQGYIKNFNEDNFTDIVRRLESDIESWYEVPHLKYLNSKITDDIYWKDAGIKFKQIEKAELKRIIKNKDIAELIRKSSAEDVSKHLKEISLKQAETEFGKRSADDILDDFTKGHTYNPGDKVTAGSPQHLKRRKYLLPRQSVEDILDNSPSNSFIRYLEETSRGLFLNSRFGTTNPDEIVKKVSKEIDLELDPKIKVAEESGNKVEADRLTELAIDQKKLVKSIMDTITHADTQASDLNKNFKTSIGVLKRFLTFTNLQGSGAAQFPEVFNVIAAKAAKQFIQTKYVREAAKYFSENKEFLNTPRGKNLVNMIGGAYDEAAMQTRYAHSGMFDEVSAASRIEKGFDTANSWMFTVNGTAPMTKIMRNAMATDSIMEIADAGQALKKGIDLEYARSVLQRYDIDEVRAKKIHTVFEKKKKVTAEYTDADIDNWSINELELISDPVLRDIVKVTSVPRATNMPQWMVKPVGSLFFMFYSYIFNLTAQQTAWRAQTFKANKSYHSSMILSQLAGGVMSVFLKDVMRGVDPTERLKHPERFAADITAYSGIAGILGDTPLMLQAALSGGGRPDALLERMSSFYGFADNVLTASQIALKGGSGTETEWKALLRLSPIATTPFVRALHDDIVESLAEKPSN